MRAVTDPALSLSLGIPPTPSPAVQRAQADDSAYDRFVDLVREMWAHEPEGRPAFSEIDDRLADIFNVQMPSANVSVSAAHDNV